MESGEQSLLADDRQALASAPEVQYLVLPDITRPYLLARVRWPDVCQAISPGRPLWQDDPGLFDLPHDPRSTRVTLREATAIATHWGIRLDSAAASPPALSLIRRMPSDWFDLSPAERRAWSIDLAETRRRTSAGATMGRRVAGPKDSKGPKHRRRGRRRAVRPLPQVVAGLAEVIFPVRGPQMPGDERVADVTALRDRSQVPAGPVDEPAPA
jgi:hypothetical protein